MGKKKEKTTAPPAQLAPLKSCEICSGSGWVPGTVAPARTTVDGRRIEYPAPVSRCPCTTRGQRDLNAAQQELDQAQKASGERIDP